MIQLNLLPDIKLEYLRIKKTKRLVVLGASTLAAGALAVLIILFLVTNVFQKSHLKALTNDINTSIAELTDNEELDKILTVQNQLISLPDLHNKKPVMSRLFGYLRQITPEKASISKVDISQEANTVKITGTGDSLETVNKFVDTLKFTTFEATQNGEKTEGQKPFSGVVLTAFGRSEKDASFSIDLTFDPAIFDSAKEITLIVPQIITTRSETEKPLFKQSEGTESIQ